MKTVELNTNLVPMFHGTYETEWMPQEQDNEGNEINIDYDFQELMQSIAQAYKDKEVYIQSDLNCSFIWNLRFTGKFFSPREYNFKTDELDFTIDINELELRKCLVGLKDNEEFAEFLQDNYTSYDGFWSFTPNSWEEISEQIQGNGDKYIQSLAAVINYQAREVIDSREDFWKSIEGHVYEYWQGNGYLGLRYTPKCWECASTLDYENDFKCQNEACDSYEKVELKDERQLRLL